MILPPTSEISHHHKVTNITMSPTSLSTFWFPIKRYINSVKSWPVQLVTFGHFHKRTLWWIRICFFMVLCCPTKSFQPSRASTQYRLIPAHCHLRDFVILRLYIKSKPAGCPLLQESGSLEFPSWSTKLVNNDFITAQNQKLPNPNNQKTSKLQPLSNTVGSFILFI